MISEPKKAAKKQKVKKLYAEVYKSGSTILSKDCTIKAKYYISESGDTSRTIIAVSISSKAGTAVWRNRVKRLITESVRLEKKSLSELVSSKGVSLYIIFSPNKLNKQNSKHIYIGNIKPAIQDILSELKSSIHEL